jgi:hypothetical protein
MPVTATVGILSCYMAGRAGPIHWSGWGVTVQGLSAGGGGAHRNIEKAVSSLRAVGSLGNALDFGFRIEDAARSMAWSEGEPRCLALCAALVDTYSEDVAMVVLLGFATLGNIYGQCHWAWNGKIRA